jgi:hypothetical protein
MRTANGILRTTLALGLVAMGLLLDLFLMAMILGEGFAPARLPAGLAAVLAVLGGAMLLVGLFLVEPRRAAEAGHHGDRPALASR